jgi:hypothetical protein
MITDVIYGMGLHIPVNFYGRHHDLITCYEMSVLQMTMVWSFFLFKTYHRIFFIGVTRQMPLV